MDPNVSGCWVVAPKHPWLAVMVVSTWIGPLNDHSIGGQSFSVNELFMRENFLLDFLFLTETWQGDGKFWALPCWLLCFWDAQPRHHDGGLAAVFWERFTYRVSHRWPRLVPLTIFFFLCTHQTILLAHLVNLDLQTGFEWPFIFYYKNGKVLILWDLNRHVEHV